MYRDFLNWLKNKSSIRRVLNRVGAHPRTPLQERLSTIAVDIARYPSTGLKADKGYFDEVSGG